MRQAASDSESEKMSGILTERMPDRFPEKMPDKMSDAKVYLSNTLLRLPAGLPERIPSYTVRKTVK